MHYKLLNVCTVLLFLIGITGLQAQESINATGGNTSGSGGSVSYTVGQVAYQTHAGTNGSVAEGVQQLHQISVVNGNDEVTGINLSVVAYPNPATDLLILGIDELYLSNVSYWLYDMQGNLLKSKKIEGARTSIIMRNLEAANYILQVIQNNQEVKTFLIVKN